MINDAVFKTKNCVVAGVDRCRGIYTVQPRYTYISCARTLSVRGPWWMLTTLCYADTRGWSISFCRPRRIRLGAVKFQNPTQQQQLWTDERSLYSIKRAYNGNSFEARDSIIYMYVVFRHDTVIIIIIYFIIYIYIIMYAKLQWNFQSSRGL